jgi:ABC-type uncharacterized transport system ATPase subunit
MTVPKEKSGAVLENVMRDYQLSDISIEEEDIGVVVERIYGKSEAMDEGVDR